MATIDEREYWDKRAVRLTAEAKAEREYVQSLPGKRELLARKLDALYADKDAHTQAEVSAVRAAIQAIDDQWQAEFLTEWTPAVTAQRRVTWNAWVKTNRPTAVMVSKQERAQGWTVDSLKRAVKAHNL